MVGLAFAVAASANFPALFLSIFWRRFTTAGAVASMWIGALSAIILIVLSPAVWVDVLKHPVAIFPLKSPGLVTIPLSFLVAVVGFTGGARGIRGAQVWRGPGPHPGGCQPRIGRCYGGQVPRLPRGWRRRRRKLACPATADSLRAPLRDQIPAPKKSQRFLRESVANACGFCHDPPKCDEIVTDSGLTYPKLITLNPPKMYQRKSFLTIVQTTACGAILATCGLAAVSTRCERRTPTTRAWKRGSRPWKGNSM